MHTTMIWLASAPLAMMSSSTFTTVPPTAGYATLHATILAEVCSAIHSPVHPYANAYTPLAVMLNAYVAVAMISSSMFTTVPPAVTLATL